MKTIYRVLRRLGMVFAPRPVDPVARFTARDWADMPPYHPLCERD